jgi:hypothetical protein
MFCFSRCCSPFVSFSSLCLLVSAAAEPWASILPADVGGWRAKQEDDGRRAMIRTRRRVGIQRRRRRKRRRTSSIRTSNTKKEGGDETRGEGAERPGPQGRRTSENKRPGHTVALSLFLSLLVAVTSLRLPLPVHHDEAKEGTSWTRQARPALPLGASSIAVSQYKS